MADNAPKLGEIDLEEFRRSGHQIVDWIADYLAHPERYPVFSRSQPEARIQKIPGSVIVTGLYFDSATRSDPKTLRLIKPNMHPVNRRLKTFSSNWSILNAATAKTISTPRGSSECGYPSFF